MGKLITFFFILFPILLLSQTHTDFKITVVAFYNCENLLDTIHQKTNNEDRVLQPAMYTDKLNKIVDVISKIGTDDKIATPDGASLIGLAEINSRWVLEDIIHHPLVKKRNYQYVHFDSKDARGIDVAFLYNPKYFAVETAKPLTVKLNIKEKNYYSRDILWIKGKLNGELMYFYINHWPSRLGGEQESEHLRWKAALICRNHIDSIIQKDSLAKIIVMGDFNDEPFNYSIQNILRGKASINNISKNELFNPWNQFSKKGIGTLAFQDTWALFDQILISPALIPKNQLGFFYYQPHIFNKPFITENIGKYKGYPMRSWDGNNYRGGYSDHFPVYITLLKRIINAN